MSVPLDRLYHYLDDCVNHDLVIYRWLPHGSRKLEDIKPLNNYSKFEFLNCPALMCHDQEPLVYDMYTTDQLRNCAIKHITIQNKHNFLLKDNVLNYIAAQHFRAVMVFMNHYDKTILLHSELYSEQVELFAKENFVPVYFWSHAVISLDWFRYAACDPRLDFKIDSITQDFLVYSRAWSGVREYRLFFMENLVNAEIVQNCKTSFCSVDQDQHYTAHDFRNKKFATQNYQLENYFSSNTYPSTASADYVCDDYVQTGIEVVLETLFDDTRWHLTEKTLRPIACGKPFILAATPGSLQYLRNYGFETFSGLVDETYDTITNSRERLDAIIQEMKRIASLDTFTKQVLYTKLHEIAQRNKQRFFNGLFDQVITEYKTNMDRAMAIMNQHCTGVHRARIQELLQQN